MADTIPELLTADHPNAWECVLTDSGDLVEHDYRPHGYHRNGVDRISLRCVWCHVVACGDVGEEDPCIEPYHHRASHRTATGVTWKKGGNRP